MPQSRTGASTLRSGASAPRETSKRTWSLPFEVSLGALAPDLRVLAPVRDWGMNREETAAYGLARGLPVRASAAAPLYSIDENLWGRAVECGALEDPMVEAPEDVWERTVDPVKAPTDPDYVEIAFENGVPVSIDGEALRFAEIVRRIDQRAGSFGVGRLDMIEDRVVGIKSREVYEVPAAAVLIMAHADLEELTLERDLLRAKRDLEVRYGELVYEGLWFSPLREALDAFNASTQRYVNGRVKVKLEPGSARVVGRQAAGSLYDVSLATYDKGDAFEHTAAE